MDTAIQRMKTWQASTQSPLAQLHEIFEEQPDTQRFIGDTMFWKYFEDIDVAHVYRHNSVEYQNLWYMFVETVVYFFLLVMLTAYVYELQSPAVYESRQEQLNYWGGCGTAGDCRINKVRDMATFWGWMQRDFVPLAFDTPDPNHPKVATITTSYAQNGFAIPYHPRFVGHTMTNLLLGSVRIRQLRVQNNQGCEVSSLFRHIYTDCYGAFDRKWQSTTAFAKRFTPTYLHPCYKWRSAAETRQTDIAGFMGVYPGDGFMLDFPNNKTESQILLSDLQRWDWVDQATRAIVIELSVLNTNVNVITTNQLVFEFSPTGSLRAKHDSFAGRVMLYTLAQNAGPDLVVFIYQIIVCILFIAGASYHVLFLMRKTGLKYAGYGWNIVDVIIMVLFFANLILRMQTYAQVSMQDVFSPDVVGHPEKFMPFSLVLPSLILSNRILCFLVLICWIKVFKYLCLVGYFRLLVRVLERCAHELVIFSLLLLVIFFGFAVAFFVALGDDDETFSTLSNSFLVLFFMLLGGFQVDVNWFKPGASQLKPIIFLCYIILVYFILFNVFMAIVLDAYTMVWMLHDSSESKDGDEAPKRNPMFAFGFTLYHRLFGQGSLVKDVDDEAIDEEDRDILLSDLPGIVSKKWLEKKRKMDAIIRENLGELLDENGEQEKEGMLQKLGRRASNLMIPTSSLELSQHRNPTAASKDELYNIPDNMAFTKVTRLQLQRLMDEDETLCLLLGTRLAVNVIKKFKGSEGGQAEVTRLQEQVFHKLDKMEKEGLDMDSEEVPDVRELSDQMSDAFNEVQNQWRQELTSVLEAASVLSEGLIEFAQGVDSVYQNHQEMCERLDASESRTTVTSSS